MIIVYESTGLIGKSIKAEVSTFAEAEAFVRARYSVAFFEADEDFADCADAYTADGLIISVQPRDLKVAA